MKNDIWLGIMIPFIGTCLGAACVFLMQHTMHGKIQKSLLGFASGVMVAASIWSLLLPAMDMVDETLENFAFIPALVGIVCGMAFLYGMDKFVPHMHFDEHTKEGVKTSFKKTTMLVMAVTLHNIPEGMAVGVAFASLLSGNVEVSMAGAFALAIGIGIQNFPEGAIISMPLKSEGMHKGKAFWYGCLSGAVEPIAALITILLSQYIEPLLPYLLAFAAGAMLYVVVEELIPETAQGKHSDLGTLGFMIGFLVMMSLDVALG